FPALDCTDSDVILSQCSILGGRANTTSGVIPGIRMRGGHLRATGDEYLPQLSYWHRITGGYRRDPSGIAHDGPAVHSDGGLVEIDPRVILSTFSGAGPFTTGSSTFVTRTIPLITTNEGNPRLGIDDLIARIH